MIPNLPRSGNYLEDMEDDRINSIEIGTIWLDEAEDIEDEQ